ncbi:MFS transporter [Gordonia otitidis]|uniref:Drug resistance protein n=1 Tax=Gordonia otitidis (strain DSM 44809 / CCUG 52243 / JCM 12355 / NBRC 100426 / IFM 10032) TaxID=1108044 RepID=H5TIJ6_GORO1|nr:MFS transporter [Gordonia otitidis]GAB33304.1 putative drug resistance protein [Gordonia otitidis NBRC 100426]
MPELSDTRLSRAERWKLVVLLSASFLLAVDFSVLNVALPEIGRDVGIGVAGLQWIITAFALPAAGLGLLFGRLGDLTGRRLLFLTGIALLGTGSLMGGLADTAWFLIAGRVIQGLGAAAVAPTALSLLTTSFEEGPRRARALGINGALISAGFTTGALLGGLLTAGLSWRAAFLINVPIAIIVLILTPILFTETCPATKPRLDLPGALLISGGLTCLVFGLTVAGETSLAHPDAYPWLAGALVLLVVFFIVESRTKDPLVAVAVLRRRTVAFGNLAGLTTFSMMSSLTYLLTLYLQDVLLMGAVLTGAMIAVIGAVSVVAANFTPKIIGRYGQKALVVTALVFQGVGTLVIAVAGSYGASWVIVLVGIVIGALGHIGTIVGYTVTATSGLPDSEQGLATGLTTTSQQVGLALGTPLIASVLAAALAGNGIAAIGASGLAAGLAVAIAVNGVLILAAAITVAIFLPRHRQAAETAQQTEPADAHA